MSKLDRREFLKLVGGSIVALGMGMGVSGSVWAADAQVQQAQIPGIGTHGSFIIRLNTTQLIIKYNNKNVC